MDIWSLFKMTMTDILSEEETLHEVSDSSSNVVFPSSLIHSFQNLCILRLSSYKGVEVVFEIESSTNRELVTSQHNQQQPIILPNLQELDLRFMDNVSHVWKCNWNKFVTFAKQQSESPFHNLTTIYIHKCKSIKYLFSPLMAEFLSKLKKVEIEYCYGIEEIVSNRDDENEEKTTSTHTSTILFPHLDSLTLVFLKNLKCIGGGGAKDGNNETSFNNTTTTTDQFEFPTHVGGVSWSLCQYPREIDISWCDALSSVIPCNAAGQMQKLQVLRIEHCYGLKEVFETQLWTSSNNDDSGCDEGNDGIPRVNNNAIMLPNLKILEIYCCWGLEDIFTFSALESLTQLEELKITFCKALKVIVKKEEEDASSSSSSSSKKVVVFPRLKSIELRDLRELEGFFLGMNEFRLPSLDYVMIYNCPKMRVFTAGASTAPQLKYIHTSVGKYSLDQQSGLNFFPDQTPSLSSHGATSSPATSEGTIWSFYNLIELDVNFNKDIKKIIPSSELLQLQKLEKIRVGFCDEVEEVFEALEAEGRNRNSGSGSGFDESSQTTTTTTLVNLPNLREMKLIYLIGLRYIWKSNQWTVFEFPNLTRVEIIECKRLENVFTSSMVGSLLQLQELCIWNCRHMEEVIVKDADVVEEDKEKESDGKRNKEILVLPRLKSLKLEELLSLKGFSLGKEDFSFPLLDTLEISRCPAITTFTNGNSSTPQLKEIEINYNSFYAGEDINSSIIKIKQQEFK